MRKVPEKRKDHGKAHGRAVGLTGRCREQRDRLGRVLTIWRELGGFCKTITYVYFF